MLRGTYSAKPADVKRQWHVIDISGKVLGRAASQIATLLKGKHKPIYTPSLDTGDHVVVINAAKVRVTGNKETEKKYYRHPRAGMPGALKVVTTSMKDGYLRKNGVPYSENAVVTEFIDRLGPEPDGAIYLLVRTTIDDPKYLQQPFVTSTHFRLEADGAAKWKPTSCKTDPPGRTK